MGVFKRGTEKQISSDVPIKDEEGVFEFF